MTTTIPDSLELDTLEQFDALISPQRLLIMEALAEGKTAKELAAEMDVPVTRLYYHLNSLLEHGIVGVIEERPKGALTERVFRAAGAAMRPSRAFLERYGAEGLSEVAALAFRHGEARFSAATKEGLIGIQSEDDLRTVAIGLSNIRISRERLDEFVREAEELLFKYKDDGSDEVPVSVFVAIHPRKAATT